MKEQVLNHQYGTIIKKFNIFTESGYSQFVWGVVSKLQIIRLEVGNTIYEDNFLSTKMYFIEQGLVKLYADNNVSFWSFRVGQNFGESDIFCNQRRNGTARSLTISKIFWISRSDIEIVLQDMPDIRKEMIRDAISFNDKLVQARK